MRQIKSEQISSAVSKLCHQANISLPDDIFFALQKAAKNESGAAKSILEDIIKNAEIAKKEDIPLCQDTGMANFFVKIGKEVFIEDGDIYSAINQGAAESYKNNYLRKSIVSDPIIRKNTGDNTPANIYIDIVEGSQIEIVFMPKGGGSSNASILKMLSPAESWTGVENFVLNAVKEKGRNACPPLILGIGIGGDFESIGLLAKKSLLREIGSKNPNNFYAQKEDDLLNKINALGIGAMGLGGKTTALAVFINTKATHIASLPVAISFQCHSSRRAKITL
ncbi:MAG: fumarate hydratase [Elusimicrobiota bacterium]|jgi:fumarate hydratase subunit alpha|nr:fumarate hydratase [Elusimicrobiota bacterium]